MKHWQKLLPVRSKTALGRKKRKKKRTPIAKLFALHANTRSVSFQNMEKNWCFLYFFINNTIYNFSCSNLFPLQRIFTPIFETSCLTLWHYRLQSTLSVWKSYSLPQPSSKKRGSNHVYTSWIDCKIFSFFIIKLNFQWIHH